MTAPVTYTNTETFQRDFAPAGVDANFPRLVTRAAVMAYNYINSRLGTRYSVPFAAPYPSAVVDISDLLTKCFVTALQARRTPIMPKPGTMGRDMQDDCGVAIAMLDDIVSGDSIIPGMSESGSGQPFHSHGTYIPIFDLDDATAHRPDSDLLDRIDDSRDQS
jgi:hypothetical protein